MQTTAARLAQVNAEREARDTEISRLKAIAVAKCACLAFDCDDARIHTVALDAAMQACAQPFEYGQPCLSARQAASLAFDRHCALQRPLIERLFFKKKDGSGHYERSDDDEIIAGLRAGTIDPNTKLPSESSLLYTAIRAHKEDVAVAALECGAQSDENWLLSQCLFEDCERALPLLLERCKLDARCAYEGQELILVAASAAKRPETIDALIKHGANANAYHSKDGYSALHAAVANDRIEVAEALVRGGASLSTRDGSGRTPLGYARDLAKVASRCAYPMKSTASIHCMVEFLTSMSGSEPAAAAQPAAVTVQLQQMAITDVAVVVPMHLGGLADALGVPPSHMLIPAGERHATLSADGSKRYLPRAISTRHMGDGRTAVVMRAGISVTPLQNALWFDEVRLRARDSRSERYGARFEACSHRELRWKGTLVSESESPWELGTMLKDERSCSQTTNDTRQHEDSARKGRYLCMQPGCASDASAFYRVRNGYVLTRNEGLVQLDHDKWSVDNTLEHARWFCAPHAERGQRNADDSMRNYEVLPLPPYMGGDVVVTSTGAESGSAQQGQ